jgi:hypothetical protein
MFIKEFNPRLNLTKNQNIHDYNTRSRIYRVAKQHNLNLYSTGPVTMGCKIYNYLPKSLKEEKVLCHFKTKLKQFLLEHCFYSIEEYFEHASVSP